MKGNPLVREIENGNYEAKYQITINSEQSHLRSGTLKRPVVYADEIDTNEEAESRLDYDGGGFSYSKNDI